MYVRMYVFEEEAGVKVAAAGGQRSRSRQTYSADAATLPNSRRNKDKTRTEIYGGAKLTAKAGLLVDPMGRGRRDKTGWMWPGGVVQEDLFPPGVLFVVLTSG